MKRVERSAVRWMSWVLVAGLLAGTGEALPPATTTISDVVYRANGAPASGTLLITWPAFTTGDSKPVAAGTMSVTVGAGGAVSIPLVPNAGAMPDGTFYRVVFKLDDGTTSTEYWVVPTTSPVTIAAIRSNVVPASVAMQQASRQYVDTQVSAKATDAAVVHKSGAETIAGAKQFTSAPTVPQPAQATEAANKAYVDASVAAVGAGAFVSKSGDVMSGPLSLSADPVAPAQAVRKSFLDLQLSGKADRVAGLVPLTELGGGATDATKCLHGDQSWGACGSSANATQILGKNIDAVAPAKTGQSYTWDQGPQSWKVQDRSEFDVRDWGVKCDSATDDAPALQGMFNAILAQTQANYTGATVRFPANLPNKCVLNSTVTIRGWGIDIRAHGARFQCNMSSGGCFFFGLTTNSNDTRSVSWSGGIFFSGVNNGTNSVFVDNSQSATIRDVVAGDAGGAQRFGHFIENWDDENQEINHLSMNGIGHFIRCDATFCGSAIFAPGNFGVHPGISHVTNADLGMQCGGNAIDWHSGNALDVSNSVIQGFAKYGILYDRNDGFAYEFVLNSVYFEAGSCANPVGNVGQASVIMQGATTLIMRGGAMTNNMPRFANNGANARQYYVVPWDAAGHVGNPLPLGTANSDNVTPITVVWPKISGAAKYDVLVLRVVAALGGDAPYGSGNYAVATNVLQSSCSALSCQITDNPALTPASYSVPGVYVVGWYPKLDYWPGGIVLSPQVDTGNSYLIAAYDGQTVPQIVNVARTTDMNVRTLGRRDNAAATPAVFNLSGVGQLFSYWPESGSPGMVGTLLYGSSEPYSGFGAPKKGRVNFGGYSWDNNFVTDLVTCRDSNLLHTLASSIYRPTADAADCALGVVGSDTGFLRAKSAWRFYFNAVPGGTGDTNAIVLDGTGINLPASSTYKVGGVNLVPLTAKGDLLAFGSAPARMAVGSDGQCLVADSTQATGLRWGSCPSGGGSGSPGGLNTDVQFNDNGTLGGVAGFTFNKLTGDLTLAGTVTATAIQTTGSGAWSVEGSFATMTAPVAGKSKMGFGALGQLQVAENGSSTFFDLSKAGHVHAAAEVTSGTLAAARLPVMGASGTSHAAGAAPDPGATVGTTRYLREDGTWATPAGGGGAGIPGGSATQVQFNDGGSFGGDNGFSYDKATGNLAVGGAVTATSFVTSGVGPWSVEGAFGTLSAPSVGKSKVGFGTSGQMQVAENGASTFVDVAKAGHTHTESDVSGLVSDLAAKAPLASAAFTGAPTAATAAVSTNTTQIATTAFVIGQASSATPAINGTAAAGTATTFARADHVHPTDTGRAAATHSHVESEVTGLAGDLPKGLMTTKGDLIGYGSAPARMGAGADGQVLVADSTQTLGFRWNFGPGANINTVATGFVFLPYITVPQGSSTGTVAAGTANQLRVVEFVLPLTITVGKVVSNITTLSAGQTLYAGVYDLSGNKLLEAALSCGTANGVSVTLGTAVALQPGTYFYAVSASDTTCAGSAISMSGGWQNMMTKNTARMGTAANSVSGGVMPATLGTVTFGTFTPVVAMVER
jgi:hypothetical protein